MKTKMRSSITCRGIICLQTNELRQVARSSVANGPLEEAADDDNDESINDPTAVVFCRTAVVIICSQAKKLRQTARDREISMSMKTFLNVHGGAAKFEDEEVPINNQTNAVGLVVALPQPSVRIFDRRLASNPST